MSQDELLKLPVTYSDTGAPPAAPKTDGKK
jgi:hypothetical protein